MLCKAALLIEADMPVALGETPGESKLRQFKVLPWKQAEVGSEEKGAAHKALCTTGRTCQ